MTKSSLKNIPVQTETIVSHPVTGVKCSALSCTYYLIGTCWKNKMSFMTKSSLKNIQVQTRIFPQFMVLAGQTSPLDVQGARWSQL